MYVQIVASPKRHCLLLERLTVNAVAGNKSRHCHSRFCVLQDTRLDNFTRKFSLQALCFALLDAAIRLCQIMISGEGFDEERGVRQFGRYLKERRDSRSVRRTRSLLTTSNRVSNVCEEDRTKDHELF